MELFIQSYIFLIGALIGSFLNVCIYRIPRGESIAFPPSHCTNCNTKIKHYDLIPILSYIFLRGKCRNCKSKVSAIYPLIELFTAIIFLLLYKKYGLTIDFFSFAIFTCFLIVIGMIDYFTQDVYTITTYSGIGIGVIFVLIKYFRGENVLSYIYGAAFGGVFLLITIILGKFIMKREAMGFGDFDICILTGVYLGFYPNIFMLILASSFGSLIIISLIALKLRNRNDPFAFGPFLSVASIVVMLYGNSLFEIYMKIFFNN
ncbi:prepilin peptidase [Clostridium sp.]|uniref:prepilin peptidase n=1 Tax=Clostridium sp. TaxID=1506 RepID=UPI002FC60AE8